MRVEKLPLAQADGHILLHNHTDATGRRVLRKGIVLTEAHLHALHALGQTEVIVAVLEAADVPENEAARLLAESLTRPGIHASTAINGRVDLLAETAGLLKIDSDRLLDFNSCPGVTLATRPDNTPVTPRTRLGTLKIIPFSLPHHVIAAAAAIARSAFIEVKPYQMRRVLQITVGGPADSTALAARFAEPLQERLLAWAATLTIGPTVAEDETALAEALRRAIDSHRPEMIIIVGQTSIMDEEDITPAAINAVGGEIVQYGAPVDPGNLVLLAYYQDIPIIGAPGCASSRGRNVIDLILPRLLTGERLTRRDILALGHGGLLE